MHVSQVTVELFLMTSTALAMCYTGHCGVVFDVNSIRYVSQVTVELFLIPSATLTLCHRSLWSCF